MINIFNSDNIEKNSPLLITSEVELLVRMIFVSGLILQNVSSDQAISFIVYISPRLKT